MPAPKVPRSLIRKLESGQESPLRGLEAIRELREYLDELEEDALCQARDRGASITEIAEIMGRTRQAVYNKLRQLADRQAERQVTPAPLPQLETPGSDAEPSPRR